MKTIPYTHQLKEYEAHRTTQARAMLWEMRTGKSKTTIDTACFLAEACEIDAVMVIAPNGVHYNWILRELPRHHWDNIEHAAHVWRFSDPKNAENFDVFLRKPGLSWFALNMESIIRDEVRAAIGRFLRRHSNILIVFDESHHFARPGAKRTAMARALARRATYRRILTGTPVENAPLQAFSQYELLDRAALGYSRFGEFKTRYAVYEIGRMKNNRTYPRLVRYEHLDELRARMAPYTSVVLRSDCEDLPPVQQDVRYIDLTTAQVTAWRALKKDLADELEKLGLYKPVYGGAALVKLQQVEGGFVKDNAGNVRDLCGQNNPKMMVLLEEIQSYNGSVIVWFAFTHEIEAAAQMLTSHDISFGKYYGRVSDKDRDRVRAEFEGRQIRIMLAQPQAGGEGHDFSAAGKIIWYSQTPDAIVRGQASERATAIGKESTQMIDFMAPGGVDEHYLGLTTNKTDLADEISRDGMRQILEQVSI